MTCLLCLAVFFDIQDLLNITSIITQIKIILALIALLILKRREPNKPSTVSVGIYVPNIIYKMYKIKIVKGIDLQQGDMTDF